MLIEYNEGNSFFHRLRASSKFLWGAVVTLWLSFMFDPLHVLILGAVILITAVVFAGLALTRLLRSILLLIIAGIGLVIIQSLFYPGATAMFTLGPLRPTFEGLAFGSAIALRMLGIVSASLIVARTTDPRDIFLSLVQAGVPYRISYLLFTALRFIPLMWYEAATIRDAQFVRGIVPQKGDLRSKIKQSRRLLIPLLASGMRVADQSATAMETRAFGLHPHRTYLHDLRATEKGIWFLIPWIVACIAYFILLLADLFPIVQ